MSRAALYALGATSLTLAAGCSGKTEPGSSDAAADDDMRVQPAYGASADGAVPEDGGQPDTGAVAAYGAPADAAFHDSAPSDAGMIGDADSGGVAAYGAPADAHEDKDSGIAPPYGIPPMDAGHKK
jgi:hypothetical protein